VNQCLNCGRPVADTGYLCHSENTNCTALMSGHLEHLAKNARELEVTITRRDKLGEGTGRSHETPLPFNEAAAETAREIHCDVRSIANIIDRTRGLADDLDTMRRSWRAAAARDLFAETAAAARYIQHHLRWVRAQGFLVNDEPFALVACKRVQDAARALARAIDSHPTLTDLGPCGNEGCEGRLLAGHGDRYAKCREGCGWVANVAETTGLLLEYARDLLLTADEISTLLSKWSTRRRIPAGTIRSWATRGLLPRKGKDGRAFLYNLGDAIDLADHLIPTSVEQGLAA
jgi:hypothetical protein